MMDIIAVKQVAYNVIRLLGHGKGGYSYLVEKEGCLYVLKQIHHEPCEYYSFGNKIEAEINDYNRLLQTGIRLPRMLDVDIENERIVKEYIDGPTIYELVKDDAMDASYIVGPSIYSFTILSFSISTSNIRGNRIPVCNNLL